MTGATKPHEGAPIARMTPPEHGQLKCMACGSTQPFNLLMNYDQQSACEKPDCNGQMMCSKWSGWASE